MKKHDLLTRIFLRDCAFLLRWTKRKDDFHIWHGATYSTMTTLLSVEMFAVNVLSLSLKAIHPNFFILNWPMWAMALVYLTFGAVIFIFVQIRFAKFRHDLTAAQGYTSSVDMIKWFFTAVAGVGSVLGIVAIYALFGDR